ncbi:hypothetical protein GVN16_04720 [Emticicia sp. CRIBPO]|uniref:hypothetical protein n=1 Tax=Emticicia sp. CRIBPO TaxID=2683258 RepID=UPI0014121909|nr:hypothetical protein [Emticicia sp. CRIBPO]NBA85049.1 hypothetical protein [Emticicia sp. CRIBPO]
MKNDIEIPEVKNVCVAVAREQNFDGTYLWKVFLLNKNDFDLKNVLVTSSGFGDTKEGEQKTSVLRHFFEEVPALGFQEIEIIDQGVFHLNNEYWVSYQADNKLFDKRYLFVPDSISDKNIIHIRMLEKDGILHE